MFREFKFLFRRGEYFVLRVIKKCYFVVVFKRGFSIRLVSVNGYESGF